MHCSRKNPWTGALRLVLLTIPLTVAAPGCCHNEPKACNDITPGAIPQPNGTYLCQWSHAETARADRDSFVFYQYEWSADKTKLTPGGREHLDGLAQCLARSACPIVIETSLDDQLDAARRGTILSVLAAKNLPLGADRVIVGRSEAEGLYGQEAVGVAARMLSNQGGGGGAGSMGGGATGSMSGGISTSGGGGLGVY